MGELGKESGDIMFDIMVKSGSTVVVNKREGENAVKVHGTLAEGGGAVNVSFYLGGFKKIEVKSSATPFCMYDVFAEAGLKTDEHFSSYLVKKLAWVRIFLEEDYEPKYFLGEQSVGLIEMFKIGLLDWVIIFHELKVQTKLGDHVSKGEER